MSLSYVDDQRDGRGWAFRERRGADPVNGFTLLADAYQATEPGYDGHVSVPVLWDRETGKVVSNNFPDITIDLGTQFGAWASAAATVQPARRKIETKAPTSGPEHGLPRVRGGYARDSLPDAALPRDHRLRRVRRVRIRPRAEFL